MIRDILSSRLAWAGFIACALFWIIAPFVPRDLLYAVINSVAVSLGIGILVAYIPGVSKTLRARPNELSMGHILVVGVVATWTALAIRTSWSWVWRYYDKPADMIDSLVLAFSGFLTILGGILHLSARDAINGQVPARTWRWVGVLTAGGIMAGSLAFAFLF